MIDGNSHLLRQKVFAKLLNIRFIVIAALRRGIRFNYINRFLFRVLLSSMCAVISAFSDSSSSTLTIRGLLLLCFFLFRFAFSLNKILFHTTDLAYRGWGYLPHETRSLDDFTVYGPWFRAHLGHRAWFKYQLKYI